MKGAIPQMHAEKKSIEAGGTVSNSTCIRLSIMMFLQFFVWGAWFTTLGQCLGEAGLSRIISSAYRSTSFAAILSPLLLGSIADYFLPAQIVMGILFLLGGALLLIAPAFASADLSEILSWIIAGHMLCYMPTLGLSNKVAFASLNGPHEFPKVRVWGTMGLVAAGLLVGMLGWSASLNTLRLGGVCSLVLGVYSFTLPHTPPSGDGKVGMRELLMVDSLRLLIKPDFLVFILCSILISIPLAYYYAYSSVFLGQLSFEAPAATMTIGQVSEVAFMMLIPTLFLRYGVKWVILIGMAAWVIRYILFAYGGVEQSTSMILSSIILHGVCFDFFFVAGLMYTDQVAPLHIRGQSQSLLVFFTQGIGMYIGYWIAGNQFAATVQDYEALNASLGISHTGPSVNILDSLWGMFTVAKPASVDPTLLSETLLQWRTFWLLPAILTAVVFTAFWFLFRESRPLGTVPCESS